MALLLLRSLVLTAERPPPAAPPRPLTSSAFTEDGSFSKAFISSRKRVKLGLGAATALPLRPPPLPGKGGLSEGGPPTTSAPLEKAVSPQPGALVPQPGYRRLCLQGGLAPPSSCAPQVGPAAGKPAARLKAEKGPGLAAALLLRGSRRAGSCPAAHPGSHSQHGATRPREKAQPAPGEL